MTKKPDDNAKKKEDKPVLDIENLLAELGNEGSLSINRIEPSWAKGHIRSVPISASERISMEWISEKFGGEKLQVRIYGSDGHKLQHLRTVEVCGPPRNGHGIELVRGPEGNSVPITQLAEAKRRYDMLHGLTPAEPVAPVPTAPPADQGLNANALLASLLSAQAQQNQAMQTMLVNRIGSLEQHLMRQVQQGATVPAGAATPADPLQNLDNFVATAHKFHEVKKAMGLNDTPAPVEDSETSTFIELAKGFLQLESDKVKANQHPQLPVGYQQQPPPPGLEQGVPPGSVPPPDFNTQQPPPAPPAPGQMPNLTDEQLKILLAHRLPGLLKNATAEQRLAYAQEVAGEDLDLGNLEDYNDEDPLEPENVPNVGQPGPNDLNLQDTDQSGLQHEGDKTSWDKSKDPDHTPAE